MDDFEGPSIAAAFEHQARSGASSAQIAAAMAATWGHVDESLTPIIGPLGLTALYKRSLQLTSRSHPWLAGLHQGAPGPDPAALRAALEQQDSHRAALAAGQLLETFYGLLNGLIGAPLTHRLLGFMWKTF